MAAMGLSRNVDRGHGPLLQCMSMSLDLPRLPPDPHTPFPPVSTALREPDGLLAHGGDVFPWFSEGQPILWWSPDPRMVFRSDGVHLSSRFRRSLRRCPWQVRADTAFAEVIAACAAVPRRGQRGTWITRGMRDAYLDLHHLGHAHSVEVFDGLRLVGGIYGVAIGRMFFGESMFSVDSGGSKVALAALAHRLCEWGWPLIDAQVENDHLLRLGAESWPRTRFVAAAGELCHLSGPVPWPWTERFGMLPARALADRSPAD